jgi:hypothetical protein
MLTELFELINSMIIQGIPEAARGYAWYRISGAIDISKDYPDLSILNTDRLDERTVDEVDSSLTQSCLSE